MSLHGIIRNSTWRSGSCDAEKGVTVYGLVLRQVPDVHNRWNRLHRRPPALAQSISQSKQEQSILFVALLPQHAAMKTPLLKEVASGRSTLEVPAMQDGAFLRRWARLSFYKSAYGTSGPARHPSRIADAQGHVP
jgi:hypothetical protein